jgi:hypothetical protein
MDMLPKIDLEIPLRPLTYNPVAGISFTDGYSMSAIVVRKPGMPIVSDMPDSRSSTTSPRQDAGAAIKAQTPDAQVS